MPISVECSCGRVLSVKEEVAGRRVRCPECRKPVRVPEKEEVLVVDTYEEVEDDYGDDYSDGYDDEWEEPRPRRPRSRSRGTQTGSRGTRQTSPRRKKKRTSAAKKSQNDNGMKGLALVVGGLVVAGLVLTGVVWGIVSIVNNSDHNVAANDAGTTPVQNAGTETPRTGQANNGTPSTPMPPMGNSGANVASAPGRFWIVLSNMRSRSQGINTIYHVDYQVVGGAPEPGAQYVLWLGSDNGLIQHYIDKEVNFSGRGTVEILAGIGMHGTMKAYAAKTAGYQKWEPVSGEIRLGSDPTTRTPPPTVAQAAGAAAQGKMFAVANARFESGITGRALVVDFVKQGGYQSGRYLLIVEGSTGSVEADITTDLITAQQGVTESVGVGAFGGGFPGGRLKVYIAKQDLLRRDSTPVSNVAYVN